MLSSVTIEKRPSRLSVVGASLNNLTLKFTMCTTQELLAFVRQLPIGIAYAPIYANTCPMQSGQLSKGKTPFERAHHHVMTPADVALQIERRPEVFQAVGIFAGPRSKGIVFLDVDRNLSRLRKKWKDTLEGAPVVTSTKSNAAKYLFRVPEELWGQVKGFGLSDTGAGYEVLWGRQGLIYGAYPGSSDGKAPAGSYGFEGDLEEVPVAPEWLLAEMRDAAGREVQDAGFIKNRKALDFSDRDPAEVAEMIQCALKVIPGQGIGSRDHWIKVGMAIHSEVPGDLGLTLWSAWSAEDPEYAGEWTEENPCEPVWKSFRKGPVSLGTLFWMADQQMPGRLWLPEDLRKVVNAVETVAQRVELVYLTGEELLQQGTKLEEEIENPALLDQAKHVLALKAGRREGAIAIDRLLDADMAYQRTKGSGPVAIADLESTPFEYLIPGLLPKPWTLLIHADGGTGKTAMCQTIAKHLSGGIPFDVYGGLVDVPKCRVLWLNGDQNERIVRRQFMQLGVECGVDVIPEWDMNWYRRFCKLQKKYKYDLIVIDSLDGCNDSNPYEENRREYALPIKRLARRNGQDFPACAILIIHHNTKSGQFRGTSAIRAAVDETWNMRRLTQQEIAERGLYPNSRCVTVEKSRDDREGKQMVFRLMKDFTYQIRHLPEARGAAVTASQQVQAVLELMRAERRPWTLSELVQHEEVGGEHTERMNRSVLEKLEQQKLVERCAPPDTANPKGKGRRPVYYRAVGTNVPGFISHARGGTKLALEQIKNPVVEMDLNCSEGPEQIQPGINKAGSTDLVPGTAAIYSGVDLLQEAGLIQTSSTPTDLDLFPVSRVNRDSNSEEPLKRYSDVEIMEIREAAEKFWA